MRSKLKGCKVIFEAWVPSLDGAIEHWSVTQALDRNLVKSKRQAKACFDDDPYYHTEKVEAVKVRIIVERCE